MSRALILAAGAMALAASPAAAQSMAGMQMPGMDMSKPMPAKKAKKKPAIQAPPARRKAVSKHTSSSRRARRTPATDDMPARTMPAEDKPGMSMAGMDMATDRSMTPDSPSMPDMSMHSMAAQAPSGTDLPAGHGAAPPVPGDHLADQIYAPAAMRQARLMLRHENGGDAFSQVMINLAEWQVHNGRDGYRWEGEGWFGGDVNRLVVKSEGEGTLGKGVDAAEVQGLYSRAIGPYFNVQAGVRHDFQPSPTQTFATIGVEGLAPYRFDVSGALFLSTRGDLLARAEGTYDERITQRLILQPRVELNFAAQDVPEDRIGAGLSEAELGLRLRYEISRQVAPYIGVSYTSQVGRSASFARRDGDAPHSTSLVLGIRTAF